MSCVKTKFLLIAASIFLFACNSGTKRAEIAGTETAPMEEIKTLSPIEAGEIFYKNKEPFGVTIDLIGEQLFDDSIVIKLRETEMLIKNNQLLVNNLQENPFMQFSLPDMQFLKYGNGRVGQGPDEFNFPHLVPTTDSILFCYLFECTNQKLYQYHQSGEITPYPFVFSSPASRMFSDKSIVNVAPDDFIYTETSSTGKSIYRTSQAGDSILTKEIYNLGLNPKRKSWTAYIGDFVVNPKQNRMAYAYKYFKIIKFMDLDAQTVKTINFEKEEFDENTTYVLDGLDKNVTHYWGACAGEDYVYFLYSGRTPFEVVQEAGKKLYYIFVEQYDWNGTPVHKYKLDHWGRFAVDDKNKRIYLASTNDDDPFFVFSLPD
jgi:hypothetical protein